MSKNKYCVANWKMNKNSAEGVGFARKLLSKDLSIASAEIVLCPSFTVMKTLEENLGDLGITVGAQNIHYEDHGAFTGEISASMLLDSGCSWVILGHSERRHVFGESNSLINQKLNTVLTTDLKPIFCIGEKLEERESGNTRTVLKEQLFQGFEGVSPDHSDSIVVAYEPVWAIGTGKNATSEMIIEAHQMVRELLNELGFKGAEIPILYGGSVKPVNAEELINCEGVDGFLIGGASLEVDSFYKIFCAFK